MQVITKPDGTPYLSVDVDDKLLKLVLVQYAPNLTINMDKRIIPELITILQEFENKKEL